ncbi:MAG TPA: hypothetical protein VNT32_03475, partial [Thermoleophilaceae bacterium]|nr:hypothetical protein [Thermoleophilaceae bacterium]
MAYVAGLGARIEPVVANSAPGVCAADFSGVPPVVVGGGAGAPGGITLRGPAARTETSPPAGETGVASVEIANSDRSFVLEADIVRSRATGRCVNGSTVFEG